MGSGIFKQGSLGNQAWLEAVRNLIPSSSSPVAFVKLLRDSIKTTSPASRKTKHRCNAFLIKVFLPLSNWLSRSNTAKLPPITTNEKFVQYYCSAK
jgi:hypothetical protein